MSGPGFEGTQAFKKRFTEHEERQISELSRTILDEDSLSQGDFVLPTSNQLFGYGVESFNAKFFFWTIHPSIFNEEPHYTDSIDRTPNPNVDPEDPCEQGDEEHRLEQPRWTDYLRKGIGQIAQLLYFLFTIKHDPSSQEYAFFVIRVLEAIVRVVHQLSGIYRSHKNLPFEFQSVVAHHQSLENILSCASVIVRTIDLEGYNLPRTIEHREAQTDPFLQWCNFYYTPHLYASSTPTTFQEFVRKVFTTCQINREKLGEWQLEQYRKIPLPLLQYPPDYKGKVPAHAAFHI